MAGDKHCLGGVLDHYGGLEGRKRSGGEGEHAVVGEEDGRAASAAFHDGVGDIFPLVIDIGGAGDFVSELIGHGGEGAGNSVPCGGPGGGEIGMGMNNAADGVVGAIEEQVVNGVDAGL